MYAKDAAPTEVLPLYGRLSSAEQHRVFERSTVAGRAPPRHPRDQRRRDEPDRARHPLCRRHRHRAHLALQQPHQDPAAADRGDLAGVGAAALRARRQNGAGHRDPPLRAKTTSRPATSSPNPRSSARASPPSSCRCSRSASATSRSSPSSLRPDSRGVKAALDLLVELGAVAPDRSSSERSDTKRAAARTRAHRPRPRDRAPADRPAVRAHADRGEAHRRAARRPRDRRGHVDPGCPRAPRGAPRRGRPPARPVHRPDERLPEPAEPLEPPAGAAGRARVERLPPALPLRAPQLRARAGVGRRPPAAERHHRRAAASRSADDGRSRRHPPRDPLGAAVAHRHPRRALGPPDGQAVVERAKRDETRPEPRGGDYLGARGARFAIFPGLRPEEEAPGRRDGRRARRDLAAVRAHRRRDRSGLGRGARRRPRQAPAERAALVEGGGSGIRLREGDAVRRRDHPAAPRAARPLRPAVRAGALRAPRARRRRVGYLAPRQAPDRVRAPQPRAAPPAREDRGARAAPRHPRSATRRCTASTTPASPGTSSTRGRSRRGGRMPHPARRACST